MRNNRSVLIYFIMTVILTLFFSMQVFANLNTLNISITEALSQTVAYNPDVGEYGSGNSMWNTSYALQSPVLFGLINLTNVGLETLSDVNITISGTEGLVSWPNLVSAPLYLTSAGGPVKRTAGVPGVGQDWWVYISVLKPGDGLLYNYTVNMVGSEPVNITESYSSNKVIEGGSFVVNISVQNSLTLPSNISNVQITKTPGRYFNQNGDAVYFNFTSISGQDSSNASLVPYNGVSQLVWNVSGLGDISPTFLGGDKFWLLLDIDVPIALDGVFPTAEGTWINQTWGAYLLVGNAVVDMTMTSLLSSLEVKSVLGQSTSSLQVNKIRLNETHWNTSATFNNTATSLDYNLTRIAIWSTNYTSGSFDPSSDVIADSIASESPELSVVNGSVWAGLTKSFAWNWVPVVWANATYKILDDGTQIKKIYDSYTVSNGYVYIEEIFVLKGGYLIKVTKKVNPIGSDMNAYNVTILLENIGSEKTPNWVSIFDLIPPEFELTNVNDMTDGYLDRDMSGAGTRYDVSQLAQLRGVESFAAIIGGDYDDYQGYRADFFEIFNGSNGDGLYDSNPSEVQFRYVINGTGSLSRVANAFLVGVDPQRTDGQVSSVNAPDTDMQINSEKNGLEGIMTLGSFFIALTALVAGFILSKKK